MHVSVDNNPLRGRDRIIDLDFLKHFFTNCISEMYVHDIEVGTTALEGKPEIVKETAATALVEGNNLLGPVSVICLQGGSGHL